MVQPTIVPVGFQNTRHDYLQTKVCRSGDVRLASGTVTVPDASAAETIVGLVPFNAGARFLITDKMVHTGVNGNQNLGVVYENAEAGTDDLTLFASASPTGFVVIDENKGIDYLTTGNGWLVIQNVDLTTAEANVKFNVGVVYDQPTN